MNVPDSIIASQARIADWRDRLLAAQRAVRALEEDQPLTSHARGLFSCTCALDSFQAWLAGQLTQADLAVKGLEDMQAGAELAGLYHSCAMRLPDDAETGPVR